MHVRRRHLEGHDQFADGGAGRHPVPRHQRRHLHRQLRRRARHAGDLRQGGRLDAHLGHQDHPAVPDRPGVQRHRQRRRHGRLGEGRRLRLLAAEGRARVAEPTLVSAWTAARRRLEAAGIDSPAIDARLLLEAAAEVSRTDILTDPHRTLTSEAAARLEGFLARRERREPVSLILGRRAFWTIMLKVSPGVLTPRPDTETILDVVLAGFPAERAFTVLDLGVGSGAILLAILAERPAARGLGVDVSEEALAVARENAANLGLAGRAALLRGDWTAGLSPESFDLVVANPPYIPTKEIATLA